MKKEAILALFLILLVGFSSAQFKQETGVNHDVEITVKRADLGNLIQAKWMEIEEDISKFFDGLFGGEKEKQPSKWAS